MSDRSDAPGVQTPQSVSPEAVREYRALLTKGEEAIDPETWAGSFPAAHGIAPRVRASGRHCLPEPARRPGRVASEGLRPDPGLAGALGEAGARRSRSAVAGRRPVVPQSARWGVNAVVVARVQVW